MSRLAIGCLLVLAACGRIGFGELERGSTDDASSTDRPGDGALTDGAPTDGTPTDGTAACAFLESCQLGEVTCCAATSSTCILETASCNGTLVRCSIYTHRGCPPRWACCITQQRPEATCYDPLFPQPC